MEKRRLFKQRELSLSNMNKWLELIIGVIFVIAGIVAWALTLDLGFWDFGTAAWNFLKGGLVWAVIMIGLLFLMLGISDLRE